jgi:hypothetical protein
MNRKGWVALTISVGVAALVLGLALGGLIGSQAFPKASPSPVPSASIVVSPSPSPVEVEVPGPVRERTPEICRRAIRLADRTMRLYLDLAQTAAAGEPIDPTLAGDAARAQDDYNEAAQRCYNS